MRNHVCTWWCRPLAAAIGVGLAAILMAIVLVIRSVL